MILLLTNDQIREIKKKLESSASTGLTFPPLDAESRQTGGVNELRLSQLIGDVTRFDLSGDFRRSSARELGKMKDPRVVEPLITALKDPDTGVRFVAAEALGDIKDRRAVEPLIAALKDQEYLVRSDAAGALGDIEDRSAIDPLIVALEDTNPRVRSAAARALGDIKDSRAIDRLIVALKDTDSGVRSTAALALDEINDPRAISPLTAALNDTDSEVRSQVFKALGDIKDAHHIKDRQSAVVGHKQSAEVPDVVDGDLTLTFLDTMDGPSSPQLLLTSHGSNKAGGWNCGAGGTCFKVVLTERTIVPRDWVHAGALLSAKPGRYSVRGKISGQQITATEIK